jgi:hypothetical protein
VSFSHSLVFLYGTLFGIDPALPARKAISPRPACFEKTKNFADGGFVGDGFVAEVDEDEMAQRFPDLNPMYTALLFSAAL